MTNRSRSCVEVHLQRLRGKGVYFLDLHAACIGPKSRKTPLEGNFKTDESIPSQTWSMIQCDWHHLHALGRVHFPFELPWHLWHLLCWTGLAAPPLRRHVSGSYGYGQCHDESHGDAASCGEMMCRFDPFVMINRWCNLMAVLRIYVMLIEIYIKIVIHLMMTL